MLRGAQPAYLAERSLDLAVLPRESELTVHLMVRVDSKVDGAACWKLQSTPKQSKVSQYSHSYLWVRKDNYAFAQIENYSKNELVRRAHYTEIRNDQGIWTAHQIDMHDLKRSSHTILKIEKLQYNLPMKDESFTLQALRRES